jgi:hypothetical protein
LLGLHLHPVDEAVALVLGDLVEQAPHAAGHPVPDVEMAIKLQFRFVVPDRRQLNRGPVVHLERATFDVEPNAVPGSKLRDLHLEVDGPLDGPPGQPGLAPGLLTARHHVGLRDLGRLGQDLLQGVDLLPHELEQRHDPFVPVNPEFHRAPQDRGVRAWPDRLPVPGDFVGWTFAGRGLAGAAFAEPPPPG